MAHLSEERRVQIEILIKSGKNQTEIASLVGCAQSTISREIRRNSSAKVGLYRGRQADFRSRERRAQSYFGSTLVRTRSFV